MKIKIKFPKKTNELSNKVIADLFINNIFAGKIHINNFYNEKMLNYAIKYANKEIEIIQRITQKNLTENILAERKSFLSRHGILANLRKKLKNIDTYYDKTDFTLKCEYEYLGFYLKFKISISESTKGVLYKISTISTKPETYFAASEKSLLKKINHIVKSFKKIALENEFTFKKMISELGIKKKQLKHINYTNHKITGNRFIFQKLPSGKYEITLKGVVVSKSSAKQIFQSLKKLS